MLQRVSNTRQGVASVEDSTAPNLKMDIDGVEAILPEIGCQSLVPDQFFSCGLKLSKEYPGTISS